MILHVDAFALDDLAPVQVMADHLGITIWGVVDRTGLAQAQLDLWTLITELRERGELETTLTVAAPPATPARSVGAENTREERWVRAVDHVRNRA